ncbi:MAG: protein of unknown function [Nitrospira sp.]
METLAVVKTDLKNTRLELQGRIAVRHPDGTVEEQCKGHLSVEGFADEAERAVGILQEVVSRLGLLLTAAAGSEQVPADQVRVCVEDVLQELKPSSTIHWYIRNTAEAFRNAEGL